ncbi:MAG: hypothetical protein KatS3mg039_0361 [Candidatus Kapaibacterium sp.]|nr:MAG: hypothetical protein KatS3mg039_0361 [Candidatus Kapabacteria bacterium]
MNAVITWLDGLFGKLPVLPDNLRTLFRQLLPWAITIGSALLILTLAAALGILSAGFVLVPMAFYAAGPLSMVDLYILSPLGAILGLLGGIGMIRGRAKGWEFAVYAELLFAISGIVTMSLGSIIAHLIGLWLLFQIRPYFSADQTPA